MVSITLAVPEELKKEMDVHPEMNWSEIARKAISEKAAEFAVFKSIVAKSKLSENGALELGKKVNEGLYKKYKKKFEELK